MQHTLEGNTHGALRDTVTSSLVGGLCISVLYILCNSYFNGIVVHVYRDHTFVLV